MDEKKELTKRIKKQREMALKELENAVRAAQKIIRNMGWDKSSLAAVQLGYYIFSINMGARQQLAQVDKILAMQKMQKMMAKNQEEGKGEKSPCHGCRERAHATK